MVPPGLISASDGVLVGGEIDLDDPVDAGRRLSAP